MSFTDLKLLKLYNHKDPKELLSLKTTDIPGATPLKMTRTRADDSEMRYLRSSLNLDQEQPQQPQEIRRIKNVDHFHRVAKKFPGMLDAFDKYVAETNYQRSLQASTSHRSNYDYNMDNLGDQYQKYSNEDQVNENNKGNGNLVANSRHQGLIPENNIKKPEEPGLKREIVQSQVINPNPAPVQKKENGLNSRRNDINMRSVPNLNLKEYSNYGDFNPYNNMKRELNTDRVGNNNLAKSTQFERSMKLMNDDINKYHRKIPISQTHRVRNPNPNNDNTHPFYEFPVDA